MFLIYLDWHLFTETETKKYIAENEITKTQIFIWECLKHQPFIILSCGKNT